VRKISPPLGFDPRTAQPIELSRPIWWVDTSVLQELDAFFFTIGCSGPTNSETWSDFSFWRELCIRQLCACRLVHLDLCCCKRTGRKLTGFRIGYEGRTFLFKCKWQCSPCNASLTPALKCGRLFEIIFLGYKVLGKHVEKGALNRLEDNIRMDFKDLRWDFVWIRAGPLAGSSCSVSIVPTCLSLHFAFPSFLSLHVCEFIFLPLQLLPLCPLQLRKAISSTVQSFQYACYVTAKFLNKSSAWSRWDSRGAT